jgi:hypothetical protein
MLAAIDYINLYRYPGGYQWVSSELISGTSPARQRSDSVLTVGLPEGSYDLALYKPPPNLFLALAETTLSETDIKRFADQYGLLGLNPSDGAVLLGLKIAPGDALPLATLLQDGVDGRALGNGELLSSWRKEIKEIRDATQLWLALRQAVSGDSSRLTRHIKWGRNDLVYYDSHPDYPLPRTSWMLGIPPDRKANSSTKDPEISEQRTIALIASDKHNSEWLKWVRAGDCTMPARYYLQQVVNEKLKNRVSAKLLWNVQRNRPHELALYFVPENLLGVAWLQFAEVINGNRPIRQCAACKSWIVISTEGSGNRSNRSTCSNACRMKVYYDRQLKARELSDQGLSIREIAKSLRADAKSVRSWIGVKRSGHQAGKSKTRQHKAKSITS